MSSGPLVENGVGKDSLLVTVTVKVNERGCVAIRGSTSILAYLTQEGKASRIKKLNKPHGIYRILLSNTAGCRNILLTDKLSFL